MRIRTLTVIPLIGLGLCGCSHSQSTEKMATIIHHNVSLKKASQQNYERDKPDVSLRPAVGPTQVANNQDLNQTPIQTLNQDLDVEIFDIPTRYAGYDVELFSAEQSDSTSAYSNPRLAEFVKLNGESEVADWQNCESQHHGYLFVSETDPKLAPGFEVCIRNRGYVLSTEFGPLSKPTLSAQSVSLRGVFQFGALSPIDSSLSP